MSSRRKVIENNLNELLSELDGRAKLLVVSKTWPAQDVKAAYEAGQRDFGENKVQELSQKAQALASSCPNIRWHFIGQLQSNKINPLLKVNQLLSIHSIDNIKLLNKLLSKNLDKKIGLFLQYNTSKEEEKAGFKNFSELMEAAQILEQAPAGGSFYLQGLMTIGAIRTESFEEDARLCFEELRSLRDELKDKLKLKELQLSMGMSQDYPIALKSGTDWVRIGSRVFGGRST